MQVTTKTVENTIDIGSETSKAIFAPGVTKVLPEFCLAYTGTALTYLRSPPYNNGGITLPYGMHYEFTAGSNTNNLLSYVYLAPGLYKVMWRQRTSNDVGTVRVNVDDQLVGTFLADQAIYGADFSVTTCINESFVVGTGSLKKVTITIATSGLGSAILWRSLTFMRYI